MTSCDKIVDLKKAPQHSDRVVREIQSDMPWKDIVKQVKTMIVDDAKFSAMDISRVIEQDPVFTAKIMKTAGVYFKDNSGSRTVIRAVIMLGTRRIYNLAVSQRMWRDE